jgi:hypothetical protein
MYSFYLFVSFIYSPVDQLQAPTLSALAYRFLKTLCIKYILLLKHEMHETDFSFS